MTTSAIYDVLTSTLTSLAPGPGHADDMVSRVASLDALPMTTIAPVAAPAGALSPPPDYLLQTQFVCDRVLIPLVVILGILGNVLSLVVLTRKEMSSPTNCFLTALAISDVSLLCLQIPMFFGLNADVAKSNSFKLFVRYYTVIMYVMTNVFLTCTCWLTVAVTVERFLSLRFMMHPRILCSTSRAKRAIIAIFLASFLFHFSKFFEYVPNVNLNQPSPLLPTELSKNADYDKAMHIINISLAALVPIVALVIFNTFLIYFLATHRRRMLKHKSVSASGATVGGTTSVDMLHVSGVVVAVVLVFVVCHSLGVFLALNIAMHGRHKIFSDYLFLAFKHVNGLLIMVNSSINFILYYSISRKFRKMFGSVFCQRLLSGKNSSWSVPMPLSENSMATAVSVRTANTNGYTRTNGDHANGNENFALHPSASTTSSRRSDNVEL